MPSHKLIAFAGWTAGAFLLFWLLLRGVQPALTTLHSDFSNYYVSARLVSQGANLDSLYNNEWFQTEMVKAGATTQGKFAPFPPVTAWLMLPLSWMSPLTAQRLFTIINLSFLLICAWGWSEVTGWRLGSSLLIVLAGGASIANNLAFGQVYLIMTALLLWSIVWMRRQKLVKAGIVIGAFATLKYFPVTMMAAFVASSRTGEQQERQTLMKVTAYSLATIAALSIAELLFFGFKVMSDYVSIALIPHLGSELKGQGMFSFLFQSWDSLARHIFVFDAEANPDPWINWPLGKTVLKMSVAILVGAATLWAMIRTRSSPRRTDIYVALVSLAALVVSPASATYHFALLLIPLALLVSGDLLPEKFRYALIAIYVMIGFIPYAWFFQLASHAGVIFAYPRLWLILLFFCVAIHGLLRKTANRA